MSGMDEKQVSLLYLFGGLALLAALGTVSLIEYRKLLGYQADTTLLGHQLRGLDRDNELREAIIRESDELARELAGVVPLLEPHGTIDEIELITHISGWCRELGIDAFSLTRRREDQPTGLWPDKQPTHKAHEAYPRRVVYLAVETSYWQLLVLLDRLERWPRWVSVDEIAVQRREPAVLGNIKLTAGLALVITEHDPNKDLAGTAPPREPDAVLRAVVRGERPTLPPPGDDLWFDRGVDWRQGAADQLPTRNPFDPFAGATLKSPR